MTRDAYIHHAEGAAAGGTLAFAFHGTGGSERQVEPLLRDLAPDAAIVAPRGDVSEHGAARNFLRRAEGDDDMADLARATVKMAGFVEAHVAAARPARVVGLGYSNGVNILACVIFERPDLFVAAVLMHPLIPWTPAAAPVRTRVLITAGARDPICPPAQTRALEHWFRGQGAEVGIHWHPGGHELDRSEITAAARFLGAVAPAGSD
jgi:phospholipase/carboxylesterase